jgi:hypothetical protein
MAHRLGPQTQVLVAVDLDYLLCSDSHAIPVPRIACQRLGAATVLFFMLVESCDWSATKRITPVYAITLLYAK